MQLAKSRCEMLVLMSCIRSHVQVDGSDLRIAALNMQGSGTLLVCLLALQFSTDVNALSTGAKVYVGQRL